MEKREGKKTFGGKKEIVWKPILIVQLGRRGGKGRGTAKEKGGEEGIPPGQTMVRSLSKKRDNS